MYLFILQEQDCLTLNHIQDYILRSLQISIPDYNPQVLMVKVKGGLNGPRKGHALATEA
jgi:hypothetical protein